MVSHRTILPILKKQYSINCKTMYVLDGIHHVPQGGPRARATDLHVYRLYNFKFLLLVLVNIILQVLQDCSRVPI